MKKRNLLAISIAGLLLLSPSLCGCAGTAPSSFQGSSAPSVNSRESGEPSSPSSVPSSKPSTPSTPSSSSSSSGLLEFSGISFGDKHVDYDGNKHTIEPEGIPSFASYEYTTSQYFSAINESGHVIKIRVIASGYRTTTYTARLYIHTPSIQGVAFDDDTIIYDGCSHALAVKNAPTSATITYRCLNDSSITNTAIDIGVYNIEATVKASGYRDAVLTATLTIKKADYIKTDPDKEAFQFDETTPRNDLIAELEKGNYTIHMTYETVRTRQDTGEVYFRGTFCDYDIAYTGDKYMSVYTSYKSTSSTDVVDTAIIETAYLSGDYALTYEREHDWEPSLRKIPSYAFEETYGQFGYWVEAYTEETEDDKYSGLSTRGYVPNVYECHVTTNTVTIMVHNRYYHSTGDNMYSGAMVNDELSTYVFTNIGNTYIDMPEEFSNDGTDVESYKFDTFYHDTIRYFQTNDKSGDACFRAIIDLDPVHIALTKKDTFILSAKFDDIPVRIIDRSYYMSMNDYSGYTLNVYFDKSGVYQGEYSDLPSVYNGTYGRINTWYSYGGTQNYYGEW